MTILKKIEFFNLHLTKDAPTYMECIFEEKMETVQEIVNREAGQFKNALHICWGVFG